MKKIKAIYATTIVLIMILSTLAVYSSSSSSTINHQEELIFKEEHSPLASRYFNQIPRHLVLIYDGGTHRSIRWDSKHFAPYVSADVNGETDWLFDGFLFLEIKDGQGRGFASGYEKDRLDARTCRCWLHQRLIQLITKNKE